MSKLDELFRGEFKKAGLMPAFFDFGRPQSDYLRRTILVVSVN